MCRPHDEQYRKLSPQADPPRPPQRSPNTTTTFEPQFQDQTTFTGVRVSFLHNSLDILFNSQIFISSMMIVQEFEITMFKQQGSLGFTLRKEDESVLGHYVRALIRDPAASDGRIQPGDKILAVSIRRNDNLIESCI